MVLGCLIVRRGRQATLFMFTQPKCASEARSAEKPRVSWQAGSFAGTQQDRLCCFRYFENVEDALMGSIGVESSGLLE